MRFQDNYETVSCRYDVLRNGVKFTEMFARGSPTVKMVADAKVKMAFSGQFIEDSSVDLHTDIIKPHLILNRVEYPLGEYRATTVTNVHKRGTDYVNIEGYDRGIRVKQQTTETRVSFAANNRYTDIVQALLIAAGIDKIICIDSTATLATTREDWEIGTTYVDIINCLLAEINYMDAWWDLDGYAHIEPYIIPSAANIKHTYKSDEYSIIKPDCETVIDTYSAYNVFTAMVSNPDLPTPLYATAVNDDPSSPISTIKRGRIPMPVVKLDNIANQAALQDFVNNLKFKSLISTEVSTFETAKAPTHLVRDTMALDHEALQGIYSELEWGITMSATGQMTHKARKVLYA